MIFGWRGLFVTNVYVHLDPVIFLGFWTLESTTNNCRKIEDQIEETIDENAKLIQNLKINLMKSYFLMKVIQRYEWKDSFIQFIDECENI